MDAAEKNRLLQRFFLGRALTNFKAPSKNSKTGFLNEGDGAAPLTKGKPFGDGASPETGHVRSFLSAAEKNRLLQRFFLGRMLEKFKPACKNSKTGFLTQTELDAP